jgi:hypothetical protein
MLNQVDPTIPIIFTDESTVEVDLSGTGIWRIRGVYPSEVFFRKDAHPVHVMVWGGIGPNGYRTPLIRCPSSVNGEAYITFLANYRIIADLDLRFGNRGYFFQQDNAPAHCIHRDVLGNFVNLLDWPARSPDLSPIEQIWAYIKKMLKRKAFKTADELFAEISEVWVAIPDEIIQNFHSSFWARCLVCQQHDGHSLNGHWKEVHDLHHAPPTN